MMILKHTSTPGTYVHTQPTDTHWYRFEIRLLTPTNPAQHIHTYIHTYIHTCPQHPLPFSGSRKRPWAGRRDPVDARRAGCRPGRSTSQPLDNATPYIHTYIHTHLTPSTQSKQQTLLIRSNNHTYIHTYMHIYIPTNSGGNGAGVQVVFHAVPARKTK